MPPKKKAAAPGRPKNSVTKESVTVRLPSDMLAELDAQAQASSMDRTTAVQIAVKALLKRGIPRTIEASQ